MASRACLWAFVGASIFNTPRKAFNGLGVPGRPQIVVVFINVSAAVSVSSSGHHLQRHGLQADTPRCRPFFLPFFGDFMPKRLQILLNEPSTWRGLVMLVTAAGIGISPEQLEALVMAGLAVSGAIGVFCRDTKDGQ